MLPGFAEAVTRVHRALVFFAAELHDHRLRCPSKACRYEQIDIATRRALPLVIQKIGE